MKTRSSRAPSLTLSVLFVFCFIFNIEFAGVFISLGLIALAVAVFYKIMLAGASFRLEKGHLLSNALLLPVLAWSILSAIVHQSDANLLALLTLKTYVFCLIAANAYAAVFLHRIALPQGRIDFVLRSVVLAFLFQAVFVFASFLSPVFRELVDGLLQSKGNLTGLEAFRVKGLANSGGANLSMAMCFAAGIAVFLGFQHNSGKYLLAAAAIVGSSTLVGRSGLAGFALLMICLTGIAAMRGDLTWKRLRLIMLLGLVFAGIAGIILYRFDPEIVELWWRWFAEDAGGSVEELQDLYVHQYSLGDLLGGKGFYEDELIGSSRTDSGYLKTLFSVGAPLTVMFYLAILIKYAHGVRAFARWSANRRLAQTFAWLLIALVFTYEMKEAMAYQNFTGRTLLFLFMIFSTFTAQTSIIRGATPAAPSPATWLRTRRDA